MIDGCACFLSLGRQKRPKGRVEEFLTFPPQPRPFLVVCCSVNSGKIVSRKEETKGVIHIKWLLISKVERWRKDRTRRGGQENVGVSEGLFKT